MLCPTQCRAGRRSAQLHSKHQPAARHRGVAPWRGWWGVFAAPQLGEGAEDSDRSFDRNVLMLTVNVMIKLSVQLYFLVQCVQSVRVVEVTSLYRAVCSVLHLTLCTINTHLMVPLSGSSRGAVHSWPYYQVFVLIIWKSKVSTNRCLDSRDMREQTPHSSSWVHDRDNFGAEVCLSSSV